MSCRDTGQLSDVRRREVGEWVEFQVAPDGFYRIQLRCIGGEQLDVKARMTVEESPDNDTAMCVEAVPDQNYGASPMASQRGEESDQPVRINVELGDQRKVKSYSTPLGRNRQGPDD